MHSNAARLTRVLVPADDARDAQVLYGRPGCRGLPRRFEEFELRAAIYVLAHWRTPYKSSGLTGQREEHMHVAVAYSALQKTRLVTSHVFLQCATVLACYHNIIFPLTGGPPILRLWGPIT